MGGRSRFLVRCASKVMGSSVAGPLAYMGIPAVSVSVGHPRGSLNPVA